MQRAHLHHPAAKHWIQLCSAIWRQREHSKRLAPPAASLGKQVLGLAKGSGEAGTVVAADMTLEQAMTVAKQKAPALTGGDLKAMTSEILGVAKSMGLTCEGQDPKVFQAALRAGDYDDRF